MIKVVVENMYMNTASDYATSMAWRACYCLDPNDISTELYSSEPEALYFKIQELKIEPIKACDLESVETSHVKDATSFTRTTKGTYNVPDGKVVAQVYYRDYATDPDVKIDVEILPSCKSAVNDLYRERVAYYQSLIGESGE